MVCMLDYEKATSFSNLINSSKLRNIKCKIYETKAGKLIAHLHVSLHVLQIFNILTIAHGIYTETDHGFAMYIADHD